MSVSVENISEDYGTHGVSVYSVVHNMTFYDAEVRASGITLFKRDGSEIEKDNPDYETLYQAVNDFVIKETKEKYNEETK